MITEEKQLRLTIGSYTIDTKAAEHLTIHTMLDNWKLHYP